MARFGSGRSRCADPWAAAAYLLGSSESFWELAIARRIGIAEQICSLLSDLVNRFRVRFLTVVSFSIRGKTNVHCPND